MKFIKHLIEEYKKDKLAKEYIQYVVKHTLSLIDTFDKQTKLEVHNKLNSWEWDNRLGTAPENWEHLPWYNNRFKHRITKSSFIDPIIEYIEKFVTLKDTLRYHHLYNLHKTEAEFEEWWRLYHC